MRSLNNELELPRLCPILGRTIEMDICFDICLVAEKASPLNELPKGMDWSETYQEQCMRCPEHIE